MMKKLIQSLVLTGVMVASAGVLADMESDKAGHDDMMGHSGMMHKADKADHANMMGHSGMHGDSAQMEQRHTKHLAEMKSKLKITADQEAAWNTFAGSMKPPANMGKRHDRAELDKLTTPERIDKMRALHKERMASMDAAMERRAEATKNLYGALSPEQQKIFDAEHRMMGKHGGNHKHEGYSKLEPLVAPTPATK